jgi:hypothetical protein
MYRAPEGGAALIGPQVAMAGTPEVLVCSLLLELDPFVQWFHA